MEFLEVRDDYRADELLVVADDLTWRPGRSSRTGLRWAAARRSSPSRGRESAWRARGRRCSRRGRSTTSPVRNQRLPSCPDGPRRRLGRVPVPLRDARAVDEQFAHVAGHAVELAGVDDTGVDVNVDAGNGAPRVPGLMSSGGFTLRTVTFPVQRPRYRQSQRQGRTLRGFREAAALTGHPARNSAKPFCDGAVDEAVRRRCFAVSR